MGDFLQLNYEAAHREATRSRHEAYCAVAAYSGILALGVITIAGLMLLAGCSGGGGESSPDATPSRSLQPQTPQPDMLTATPQGLLLGKASGQGQTLIFVRPNLHQSAFYGDVFLANGLVYYPREAPSLFFDWPNQDIWSVRTDGTADHAVLNTTADEFVLDAQGPVAIYEQNTYTLASGLERTEYGSLLHGSNHAVLPISEPFTHYRFMSGKVFFNNEQQIFSTNVDGSGLNTHATVRFPVTLAASDAFSNTLIFTERNYSQGWATIHAAPISGVGDTDLSDGHSYATYAGHAGERVVFHVCVIIKEAGESPRAGACDVHSVNSNGSSLAVLASHAANEAVQAIIGDHVIIRRNLSGNDQLVAVPVAGGSERPIMTMTDSEFVQLVAGDKLIVSRPSGTWTLDLAGSLDQIGNVSAHSGLIVIGNALCLNNGYAVWCMPLDGGTPAVKIADVGRVLGAL